MPGVPIASAIGRTAPFSVGSPDRRVVLLGANVEALMGDRRHTKPAIAELYGVGGQGAAQIASFGDILSKTLGLFIKLKKDPRFYGLEAGKYEVLYPN